MKLMRHGLATPIIVDMNQTGYLRPRSVAALHGDPAPLPSRSASRVVVGATVAGLSLGSTDLFAQTALPYPWANLANSGAVWALGAFVVGMWARRARWHAAVAGTILLAVAVESYYLAAVIFLHDSTTTLWSATTLLWLVIAAFVGPIFGVAGSYIHSVRPGIRFAAAAIAGLVFMAEAAVGLGRSQGGPSSRPGLQMTLIEVVLAVIVPVVLLLATRARATTQPDGADH